MSEKINVKGDGNQEIPVFLRKKINSKVSVDQGDAPSAASKTIQEIYDERDEIEQLTKAIQALEEKLAPVLMSPLEKDWESAEQPEPTTDLARRIRENRSRLVSATEIIRRITERIDL